MSGSQRLGLVQGASLEISASVAETMRHLESGHVETLDQYLHYVFTSRRETAEEYHRRTGSPAGPAAAAGRLRRYRVIAGFAEHDERFGSGAEVEVQREAAPTRYETVDLVRPAIDEETSRALGEGDWQPSLLWVDVIELLDEPGPAQARTGRDSQLRR
jgi:hypothetical protein